MELEKEDSDEDEDMEDDGADATRNEQHTAQLSYEVDLCFCHQQCFAQLRFCGVWRVTAAC